MSRLLLGACAGLSVVVAASGAAAQAIPVPRTSSVEVVVPSRFQLDRLGMERMWMAQATLDPARDTVRYLSNDEEFVYVQATSGLVTCFDAETGQRKWAVQLGARDHAAQPVASNEEFVLVPVGMTLYALEKLSGDLLWEMRLPAIPSTPIVLDDSRFYFGTFEGSVYAYTLKKVDDLFRRGLLPQYTGTALAWRYKTSQRISAPPIATGRVVEFTSLNGSLYSVSAADRQLLFQFETDAPISAAPVWYKGHLFLASEDFDFYCLNADNGHLKWRFVTGLPIRTSPRCIDDHAYLTPIRGGMYSIDTAGGHVRWWRPEAVHFVSASKSDILATDRLGDVLALSRTDGAVRGVLPLRSFTVKPANDRIDRLYAATSGGRVLAIREKTATFPLYFQNPERRPILPEFAPENPEPEVPADPAPPADPNAPANPADAPAAPDGGTGTP